MMSIQIDNEYSNHYHFSKRKNRNSERIGDILKAVGGVGSDGKKGHVSLQLLQKTFIKSHILICPFEF